MKRNLVFKASSIAAAIALSAVLSNPAVAQDNSSASPSYDTQPPMDQPTRSYEDRYQSSQPQGAKGPIRSDQSSLNYGLEQQGSRWGPTKYDRTYGNGYVGFLQWQQTGSNSP